VKKAVRLLAAVLCAVLLVSVFSACGGMEIMEMEDNPAYSTDTASKDYAGRKLRILLSIGGGGNYYEPVARRMMELYPGLEVEIEYSNTADDSLRTQALAMNMPDIFSVNCSKLPWYEAIEQGIARPIDEILTLPTMDGTATLGDVIDLTPYSLGEYEGEHYVMHEYQYCCGLWYDAAYFRENHLTVPTDWESLQTLAEEASVLGKKLFGYMGVEPDEYGGTHWFWPMVASVDPGLLQELYNLQSEAWESDSMQRVLDRMEFLRDGGYYDQNTLGCGATETQIAFINHDFLLYPCGSWLETEMADAWTEGWELTYLPYSFGEGEEDGTMMRVTLASMVSHDTKNWDLVCEFYRIFFSDEEAIRGEAVSHRNVTLVKGFSAENPQLMDDSVFTALEAMDSMKTISFACATWYPTLHREIGNMLNGFMGGDLDRDDFVKRGYRAWEEVRKDELIMKYPYNG